MHREVAEFVARRWSVPRGRVHVELRPMHGGLESSVFRASLLGACRGAPRHLIVKMLKDEHRRESRVYRTLWRHWKTPPIPELHGVHSTGATEYLFLEYVPSSSDWPWSDGSVAAAGCRALARLHDTPVPGPSAAFEWGYESELAWSAEETLELALSLRREQGERFWPRLGDLRCVVRGLPEVRGRLLESETTIMHGDVHPGNVIVPEPSSENPVALIDWARARIGSPLEDIACWLHSLGCWEPEARRRHDSLLRTYLESRREPRPITAELRRLYWFACLSNGLSGAIRYHLAVLGDEARSEGERYESYRALREWQRVVRHAAGLLRARPGRAR